MTDSVLFFNMKKLLKGGILSMENTKKAKAIGCSNEDECRSIGEGKRETRWGTKATTPNIIGDDCGSCCFLIWDRKTKT